MQYHIREKPCRLDGEKDSDKAQDGSDCIDFPPLLFQHKNTEKAGDDGGSKGQCGSVSNPHLYLILCFIKIPL